ncbi:MAG: hypothetical protein WC071_05020 [Victivallaceae bacterium]
MILKINKYMLTLIASYGMLSAMPLKAETAKGEETTKSIRDSIGREVVSEQTIEAEANRYMKKANDAFIKNNYKDAVENYLEAINILKKIGNGENVFFKSKIDKCKEQISKSYQYWAMDLSFEAEKKSYSKDFEKAIELCKLAVEIYPACKKEMTIKIAAFEKLRDASERRKETEPSKIVPGKDEQDYSIQVSLKQAQVLVEAGRLEDAKTKYEQILLLDPYKAEAIQGLRAVNIRIGKIADQRYFNTHKERIAEEQWKWATPIIPEAADGDAKNTSGEPIRKENAEDKIQQKLNGIIIPRIDFEDVTIPTAIKYLREQSKQLDPEGVGVNIFLRLKPLEGTTAKAEAAKPAEGGDGGGDAATAEGDDKKFSVVNLILTKPTSLGEAIRFLCQAAKLKFRIEKYAVVIASDDVALDDLETKIFPVEQGSLAAVGGGEDPEALKKHFEERGIKFPDGAKIVYDARISRLIVTNTVDNIRKVELVIENELNSKDPMVQVQAKFIEVKQDDLKELSFDYYLSRPIVDNPGTANGQLQFDQNDPTLRNLNSSGSPDKLFVYHRETNGYNFDFMVYALDQVNTQDILSSPKITTMNGQEASIRMVREVYLPDDWSEAQFTTTSNTGSTGSASTVSTYVSGVPQFGDATELGIMLKVTPEVDLPRRTITMRMNPTVQSLVGWTEYTYKLTGTGVPAGATESILKAIVAIRTLDTKITLYDGETIVLGGIIKDNSEQIDDKIPILGDIPLVGRFFQSQSSKSVKTNLLIFLTCRLVKPDGTPFFPDESVIRGIPEFKNLH